MGALQKGNKLDRDLARVRIAPIEVKKEVSGSLIIILLI